ncbi:MAG: hydrolase [Chloroflexaceae bacterium]|nr:hydrolase [Chloroflexaceae bacterium]
MHIETTVLVVVDVQGNLAQAMYQKKELLQNLTKLIRGARALDLPIMLTEQNREKLGPTLPELLEWMPDVTPINKMSFSCYGDEAFVQELRATRRRRVLLAGIETHVCIYQTALDLLHHEYTVDLVVDAVSSRTEQNRQIGLERLGNAGVYLSSTEMALFELLRVAQGPAFKAILPIVK